MGRISVHVILCYTNLTHFNNKQPPGNEVSIISSPRGIINIQFNDFNVYPDVISGILYLGASPPQNASKVSKDSEMKTKKSITQLIVDVCIIFVQSLKLFLLLLTVPYNETQSSVSYAKV